jgi:hypothetical protein
MNGNIVAPLPSCALVLALTGEPDDDEDEGSGLHLGSQ